MNRYAVTSTKAEGYLVFAYNGKGYLVHYENCTWDMSDEQHLFMLGALKHCLSEANMLTWAYDTGKQVIKLRTDLSFERFWREWDDARNRFKCEPLWKKATMEQRQYLLQNIMAYRYYCEQNNGWYTPMLADTFMREHWRDEWFKALSAPKKPENKNK